MAFLASYLESSALTSGSIGYTVWSSFQAVPSLPKYISPDPESQTLEDFISYPKSLQHRLSTKIAADCVDELIKHAPCERDVARLRSLQGKGAGAWLDVVLTSDKHAVKSNQFSLACYLRLGLALPFINWIRTVTMDMIWMSRDSIYSPANMAVGLCGPTTLS